MKVARFHENSSLSAVGEADCECSGEDGLHRNYGPMHVTYSKGAILLGC